MNMTEEYIFAMYIADTPVNVHYYIITLKKETLVLIRTIIVTPDNRPLYRTRTKELDDQIIEIIKEETNKAKNAA